MARALTGWRRSPTRSSMDRWWHSTGVQASRCSCPFSYREQTCRFRNATTSIMSHTAPARYRSSRSRIEVKPASARRSALPSRQPQMMSQDLRSRFRPDGHRRQSTLCRFDQVQQVSFTESPRDPARMGILGIAMPANATVVRCSRPKSCPSESGLEVSHPQPLRHQGAEFAHRRGSDGNR